MESELIQEKRARFSDERVSSRGKNDVCKSLQGLVTQFHKLTVRRHPQEMYAKQFAANIYLFNPSHFLYINWNKTLKQSETGLGFIKPH